MIARSLPLALALAVVAATPTLGQVAAYNPYADSQEAPAPLAPDGTVQWGVFYKSAAMQSAYQRLWNMGSCRGTNRAITEPVNRNKLIIDRLPEADYEGIVVSATGGLAGGLIAFAERGGGESAEPLVVQLHPAGVTRLRVSGRAPASVLRVGHVIRLVASVDAEGRGLEPVGGFDLVTPPADFVPDAVQADVRGMIVGTVRRIHKDTLTLHVPVGKIKKLTFKVAADAVATIDAGQLDLVAAGDTITLTGRLWSGEGGMGAGTVFASDVVVSKPVLPGEVAAAAVADRP